MIERKKLKIGKMENNDKEQLLEELDKIDDQLFQIDMNDTWNDKLSKRYEDLMRERISIVTKLNKINEKEVIDNNGNTINN